MAGDVLAPRPEYFWTTIDGLKLRPCVMRTGHLFHTVVMIWHHRMPEEMTLYPHRRYDLMKSDESLTAALKVMMPELASRDDMAEHQKRTLKRMFMHLRGRPDLLGGKVLEIEG